MIFLIYTILVIQQQYKGMATVESDPCKSAKHESAIVVDMCKSRFVQEDAKHGESPFDSVVLRIMTQQDNCTCRVTIENQIETISIGLRKYGGLLSSAPVAYGCGLAVDINYIPDMLAGNVIAPIDCLVNDKFRNIPVEQNSALQFKSRIINGTFTRGYCIRIQRDINSNHSQVLRIDCDAPMTTGQTTEQIKTFDPPQSSTQKPVLERSTTNSSNTNYATTVTTTNVKHQSLTTTTDTTTGLQQTAYIAIGAGSGVALLLLVVLVVCLRRKSTRNAGTNGYVDSSNQEDESDDKLPDNVLYVSAGEFDITGCRCSTADMDTARSSNNELSMEGNYSTVDEDMPNSSHKRLNMEGDYNTVDEDTRKSSNEILSVEGNYSTVDEDMPKSSTNRLSTDENYSTVELDEHLDTNSSYPENSKLGQGKWKQKPTIKPKPTSSCINSEEYYSSDQNIKHITPPNGGDNVYAVVDTSSKHFHITNGDKGEGARQPDHTYAVVDKARKRKSSPDETNKKKFEINAGNR